MPGEPSEPWPIWPLGFASEPEDRRAALVLSGLRGLMASRTLPAASRAGTASACLELVRAGQLGSDNDRLFERKADVGAMEAAVEACGARFLTWDDAEYPSQLRTIHDPPFALFIRGRELPAADSAVAIVGARRCSSLGREIAHDIGHGLATAGVSVVSGAAHGIDSASHQGALDAGGHTVAVLGCGIDVAYPARSRALIRDIAERGTLLSEYPPGVPPDPFRFPARNRIVAGLCSATVVVEGAEGSGSNITGEHALEFGRDVFAVPGSVNNALSHVPLALIRDGATMIRGVRDLLADLQLDQVAALPPPDLTLAERAALDALVGLTLPERVARELDLGLADVVPLLMGLEIRGLVRSVGGRYEATLAAGRGRSAG